MRRSKNVVREKKVSFKKSPIALAISLALPGLALGQSAPQAALSPVMSEVVVRSTAIKPVQPESTTLGASVIVPKRATTSDSASLIADVPGVSLYGAGGVSSLPVLHGLADDRLRVQVDGMDLLAACPNHMNPPLSYIDPSHVASIKVFSGLSPVSAGGDSLGGAILVSSPTPEFAAPGQKLVKGEVGAFYRSNGNAIGANVSATAADENLSVTYSGSTAKAGDYRAAKDFKAAAPAAAGRGWLDADTVGSSSYKTRNQEVAFAVRADNNLFEAKFGVQSVPYEGFPNQRMDMTGNESTRVNLRYLGQYSWGLLEARAYHEHTRHQMNFGDDKQFFYGNGIPGMPMDTDGENTGATLKADLNLGEKDVLRVGGDYQMYRLDDWWSPSGGGMGPNTFWNINHGQRDRIGVFGEWESRWNGGWTSLLGLRSDQVRMNTGDAHGYNDASATYAGDVARFNGLDRQRTDNNFNLTAMARYMQDAQHSYEFGYAMKTRSPNLYERYTWSTGGMAMVMNNFVGDGNGYVGNPDLKPETAHTLSATADWHDASGEMWGVKLTPYYTYVDNFIDAQRCNIGTNSTCSAAKQAATTGFVYLQYVNQSAQIYGFDLSGHMFLGHSSTFGSFNASGVLNYVRGQNQTTGDGLYNLMPLNTRLALVQQSGGWTNTAEAQLVAGKAHVSRVRDEVPTGGYSLFNLRSSYEWKQVRVDFGIENLLNKFYFLPLGGAYVGQGMTMSGAGVPWGVPVPGMGRSFYTGLNFKF
ncbi:MAG: TonB-dependent receptor [Zoogloea sp.]|nr:TonB-dependent receptor [Zoogloea sp.]